MKNYTVIAHNIENKNALVITTLKAKTRKEAQKLAMQNYWQYLSTNEQMIVANDSQYEEFWRERVERTDALTR